MLMGLVVVDRVSGAGRIKPSVVELVVKLSSTIAGEDEFRAGEEEEVVCVVVVVVCVVDNVRMLSITLVVVDVMFGFKDG